MSRRWKPWRKSQDPLAAQSERQERIERTLWGDQGNQRLPDDETLIEQYKLFVEAADRVSHRRGAANNYFLLVNSGATVALSALGVSTSDSSSWPLFFATVVLVAICGAWYYLVRSYRQLSSAKWAVVGALEARMPSSPWSAEWEALGAGRDRSRYWPLTHIERFVPVLFAAIYAGAFIIIAFVI